MVYGVNSYSEECRNSNSNGREREQEREEERILNFGVKINEMRGSIYRIPDGSDRFEYLIQMPILKDEFWIMCREVLDSSKMNGPDAFPTIKLKA